MDTQDTQKKRRMQALGAELARLRQQASMPRQADLQRVCGVGVRTISNVETGKTLPRISTMRKIEAALDLPPGATDDFLDGTIHRLQPIHDTQHDFYAREIRDDFEAEIWALDKRPEEERWSFIFAHRERYAQASEQRSAQPLRRTGS